MNSIVAESVTFAISESFQNQRFIVLRTCDSNGEQEITGIVTKMDHAFRRIELSHKRGVDWIPLNDIVEVLIGLD